MELLMYFVCCLFMGFCLIDRLSWTHYAPSLHRPKLTKLSLFILVGLIALACEAPEAPSSHFIPISDDADASSTGEQNNAGNEVRELVYQETFDGAWAHYSQVSTCVDIGSSLEQINRTLYRVNLSQKAHGGMIEEWEACEIDLTPVIGVKARIPEKLRKSIYPLTTDQGQAVGSPPEQRYVSGPVVVLWGVDMDDPTIDPMPEDGTDERIYDMDGDGEVGATLQIGDTCEAYMVQRGQTSYSGVLTAPNVIEGEALSVTEQLVIDASSPLCKTSYQTRSQPRRSFFKRVRIDGRGGSLNLDLDDDGDLSCEELLMGRDTLFEEHFEVQEVDDTSCRL